MLKTVIASVLVLGTISIADAMPRAPLSSGVSLPVVKAAVIIKKVVRRRAPVMRRTVVRKTIIRR